MFDPKLPMNSLLKKTKDTISTNIFKETIKKFGNKCILILDKRGSYFLNDFFTLTEVINMGIISVDSIYFKRKPYENYEAIYIISGCKESINNMSNDFTGEKPLYKNCHVFCLDEIDDDVMNLIVQKRKFIKYIKTLKQIMINFIPIDKNTFSFGNDQNYNCLYNLFNYDKSQITCDINVSKLVAVCQCLDNYPNIAYFSPDKNCKLIAEKVNANLKQYFSNKKNIKKNGILLILTRFIDFTSPIQFGLNIQHIFLELLRKKDDKYYNKVSIKDEKNNTEKEIILNYKNEIFCKYKNMSIGDTFKKIEEDFKNFKESEVGQLHKINQKKDVDLAFALKNVPKYHYYVESYSQIIKLCKETDILLKGRNLMNLLEIQKNIISKINERGKNISDKEIVSLIKDNKQLFSKSDLMRLLCLIRYNYPKIDIDNLIKDIETNKIKFKEDDKTIINFFEKKKCLFNSDIIEQLDQQLITYRIKNNYQTEEEIKNQDDQSYPYIKESKLTTICDMCSKNQLPKAFFSFVEKPENLPQKSLKINLGLFGSKQEEDENDSNQNLILFCLGGLSNFEIASIEQGFETGQWGVNLIIGSNKIYNYKQYFGELISYIKGNNSIKTVEESMPEEIKNKKKEDEEKDKQGNKEPKIDINKIENKKKNEGKYSKEKLKKNDLENTDDSDMK